MQDGIIYFLLNSDEQTLQGFKVSLGMDLMSPKDILNILMVNGFQDFKEIMYADLTSKRITSESLALLHMLSELNAFSAIKN